MKYTNKKK